MQFLKTSLALAASVMLATCNLATASVLGVGVECPVIQILAVDAMPHTEGIFYPEAVADQGQKIHSIELYKMGHPFILEDFVDLVPEPAAEQFETADITDLKINRLHQHHANCSHQKIEVGWRHI